MTGSGERSSGSAPTRSVSTLVSGWARHREAIEAVHERFGLPVIFSEVGYRSLSTTCLHPWDVAEQGAYDPKAQAAAYEAVFRVWWKVPWWRGVHWWSVRPRFEDGQPRVHDVTPRAWRVLRRWYAQRAGPIGW